MSTAMDLQTSLQGEYACLVILGEEYGVRTSQIRSVVQTPAVRRVPRAPAFVAGVANIGGRIVPVLDPVERLGFPRPEHRDGPAGRRLVLVVLDHALYGLMVDGVASIRTVGAEAIEPVHPLVAGSTFVSGMAKLGERLVYLLDTEAFVVGGLARDGDEQKAYEAFATRADQLPERHAEEPRQRFLCLSIADEEYGLASSGLRGVIPAADMEGLPGGPDYVAGIVRDRGAVLPVIDLQKKRGLEGAPYAPGSRIAVVAAGGGAFGVLAHSAREFLHIAEREIKAMPAVMARGERTHIKGVGMLEDGERLVVLLDETRILEEAEIAGLQERDDIMMAIQEQGIDDTRQAGTRSFLAFRLGGASFALPLEALARVLLYRAPTPIPRAPGHIRGLVADEGELVPVLDLGRRLGLAGDDGGEGTRIIVVSGTDAVYGVTADSVWGILRVVKQDVTPPPERVEGFDARFLKGMVRSGDEGFLVLDATVLLHD